MHSYVTEYVLSCHSLLEVNTCIRYYLSVSFIQMMDRGGVQPMQDRAIRVVLVGHSYIRRLRDYMSMSRERASLGLHGIEVQCEGVGGARLGSRQTIRRLLQAVSAHHPFIIFVHIGENDLGHMPDGQITHELLDFIHRLSRLCSSHVVVVGQLISFPQTRHEHRNSVRCINAYLRLAIPRHHVFWRHQCGLTSNSADLFLADGVHLNTEGMRRYFRNIRTVVGRVLRHNHPTYWRPQSWTLTHFCHFLQPHVWELYLYRWAVADIILKLNSLNVNLLLHSDIYFSPYLLKRLMSMLYS